MAKTENLQAQLVSFLRGKGYAIPISDLHRALLRYGTTISYHELESYLIENDQYWRYRRNGTVELRPDVDTSLLRSLPLAPGADRLGQSDSGAREKIHDLISYYIECAEEEGKLPQPYRQYENATFVCLNNELVSVGRNRFIEPISAEKGDFIKNATSGKSAIFYGYPFMLQWVEADDGEFADYKVIPVLIFHVDLLAHSPELVFEFRNPKPRVNPAFLTCLPKNERSYVHRMLDTEVKEGTTFHQRVALISELIGSLEFVEILDCGAVKKVPSISSLKKEQTGIYNRSGLFLGNPNPYVRGLIKDLRALVDMPADVLAETALGHFLAPQSSSSSSRSAAESQPEKICEVSPLNFYQQSAVKKALSEPISLITGPPGTGKSQVVLNLITSAILNGESVLLASRNHKALDVVVDRFNGLLKDSCALIRLGGEHDGKLDQYMQQVLDTTEQEQKFSIRKVMESAERAQAQVDDIQKELAVVAEKLARANNYEHDLNLVCHQIFQADGDAFADNFASIDINHLCAYIKALSRLKKLEKLPLVLYRPLASLLSEKHARLLEAHIKKQGFDIDIPKIIDPSNVGRQLAKLGKFSRAVYVAKQLHDARIHLERAEQVSNIFAELDRSRTELIKRNRDRFPAQISQLQSKLRTDDSLRRAVANFCGFFKSAKSSLQSSGNRKQNMDHFAKLFPKVMQVVPAWAVTNLSAHGRFPLKPGLFDLLIVDEAAQCDIPSTLPLLFRAKRAVIIGDPIQLAPIRNLDPRIEMDMRTRHSLNSPSEANYWYNDNSLFDAASYAATGLGRTFLAFHYRCHPDIIGFCNESEWYDDKLDIFTIEKNLARPPFWEQGCHWENVESKLQKPTENSSKFWLPEEVEEVCLVVKKLLEKGDFGGSIGVVSPMREMANRIRDRMERVINPKLAACAQLHVQTAHGFQGDERDIIVYAMCIHPDMPKGAVWFMNEQKNLFNVALSRARAAFIAVGDKSAVTSVSIHYLEKFARHVDQVEKVRQDRESSYDPNPVFTPEQKWEEILFTALINRGCFPHCQYPIGPYRLDFALFAEDGRRLDLEVDGEAWHKDSAGVRLQKDVDRDIYVKAQGWDVKRFWVYELKENIERCLTEIEQWLR